MFKRALFLLAIVLGVGVVSGQTSSNPWTDAQLQNPEALANILRNPKVQQPLIFNIGPMENIKGAVNIGPTKNKTNLDKLRQALLNVPKDRSIIIYCGCCPIRVCPNIRPAFELLNEMKFTKAKLLNLEHNLKTNWIDEGFPM